MLAYEVMRESVKDPDTGQWIPALVWAWRHGQAVQVRAIHNAYHLQADYERKLDWARARGASERDLWEYWSGHGGHGYFEIRTCPELIEAPDLQTLLRREMHKLLFPPGTRDPEAHFHFHRRPPPGEPGAAKIRKAIEQLVRAGATVEVHMADGLPLPAWPVMYAEYTEDGHFQFWWAGFDGHLHSQKVHSWAEDDGALHFRTPDEAVIWLEPIWSPDHRQTLQEFTQELGAGTIPCPKTGSHYRGVEVR